MSTSRKRRLTRTFFLGVTAVALITECWFAWDGDPETDPWTDLIGQYVPWQLALAVFGALLLWVPAHFIVRYRRELRENEARVQSALVDSGIQQQVIDQLRGLLHREAPHKFDELGRPRPHVRLSEEDNGQETLF